MLCDNGREVYDNGRFALQGRGMRFQVAGSKMQGFRLAQFQGSDVC